MHQNLGFLFAAFAITWMGLFAYLFFIRRLLADARERISELEAEVNDRAATDGRDSNPTIT